MRLLTVNPGDRIKAVDGNPVDKLTVDGVKSLLRGEPDTSLMITVERDGATEDTITMPLRRKLVRLPDVTLATIDSEGVGYLKLEGFSEGTAQEMANAITKLQQQQRGLNALVLDMRDNPGGLLDAAVAVSQQLVPMGTEIVSTSGRVYGDGTLSYRSTRPPLLNPNVRLVVLVNQNTASAAEIVSGVVQDTDRGVIVGERTFGKGLVQIVEPLPGGGALKLTVAKYYTPSGRCIQAVAYDGGRLEASAKSTAAAVADAPAGESADPLDPTVPPLQAPETPEPAKAAPSAAPTPAPGADLAGALRDIGDSRDPSRPKAAAGEELTVYVTEHGRAVKAGGGIGPDVLVQGRELGELERSLLQRGLFFDFAGEWLKTHAAPIELLAQRVDSQQEDAYRDFQTYVRQRVSKEESLQLEPIGLQRQLDALQKSIGKSAGAGASRERSLRELATLRKQLQDDQLDEFRTQKASLKQDMTESLLGRLTPPSVRLAAQLGNDPQVETALKVAKDLTKYEELLTPDPSLMDDAKTTTADGRKIVRRPPLQPLPIANQLFPSDKLAIEEHRVYQRFS